MQFMITTGNLDEITGLINYIKTIKPLPDEVSIDLPSPLTPFGQHIEDRRLQGKYVGLIRHIPPSLRPEVKKVRKEQGIEAALSFGGNLRAQLRSKPKPPSNGSTHRYRKTCEWCRRGFLAQQKRTRVCSKRCRDAEYRHRSIRKVKVDASA